MYRLTLTVVQVMDLYECHATLWDTSPLGFTEQVAQSHMTVHLPAQGWSRDEFADILSAVRQWSDRAISE
jgi:hypothetical protein